MSDNLSFENFIDYDKKLQQYLMQEGMIESFAATKIEGLKGMVANLDMKKSTDVDQISFLMWMLIDEFVILLNNGFLWTVIDLDFFEKILTTNVPALNIVGFAGYTPLGGSIGSSNESLPYYNCIKFIGQYTNEQWVYDKCLRILEALTEKIDGPIKNPPVIMYLMNYNNNSDIDTTKNKFKIKSPKWGHIDKLHDFKYSVYNPDPSHERQYNRYKRDLQLSFRRLVNDFGQNVAAICLADCMVHSHYHVIKDTTSISRFYSKISDSKLESDVEQILIKISDVVMPIHIPNPNPNPNQNPNPNPSPITKIQHIINEKIRFIDKTDYSKMWSLAIEAFVYVKDSRSGSDNGNDNGNDSDSDSDNNNKESIILKRELLMELYRRNLAEPNSKFSHNLMRNAAESGRLWLVKFLIMHGVPTRDLPEWGSWPWVLESKQLADILLEPVKDYSGFGQKWIAERTRDRKNVYDYLIGGNYI